MPVQTVLTKERERRRRFGTEQRFSSKSISCSGLDYVSSHLETEESSYENILDPQQNPTRVSHKRTQTGEPTTSVDVLVASKAGVAHKMPDPYEYSEELSPRSGHTTSVTSPVVIASRPGSFVKLANKGVQTTCSICHPHIYVEHGPPPIIVVEGTAPVAKKSSLRMSDRGRVYVVPRAMYCLTCLVIGAVFLSPVVYMVIINKAVTSDTPSDNASVNATTPNSKNIAQLLSGGRFQEPFPCVVPVSLLQHISQGGSDTHNKLLLMG